MRPNCVCMQQLESRALLSAGALDTTYSAGFGGGEFAANVVKMQLDGKSIHGQNLSTDHGITTIPSLWRVMPNGEVDRTFKAKMKTWVDDVEVDSAGRIIVAA